MLVLASAASTGTIAGFNTVSEASGASWVLAGANTITAGATLGIAGSLAVGGNLTLAGGTLSGSGVATGSIVDDGRIVAVGGTLIVQDAVAGTGAAVIRAGATLVADAPFSVAGIVFAVGGNESLVVQTPAQPGGELVGFSLGDTVDLRDIQAKSVSFASGTLTLLGSLGTAIGSLDFLGDYLTANFTVNSDGHGGTTIGFKVAAARRQWSACRWHRDRCGVAAIGLDQAGGGSGVRVQIRHRWEISEVTQGFGADCGESPAGMIRSAYHARPTNKKGPETGPKSLPPPGACLAAAADPRDTSTSIGKHIMAVKDFSVGEPVRDALSRPRQRRQ